MMEKRVTTVSGAGKTDNSVLQLRVKELNWNVL